MGRRHSLRKTRYSRVKGAARSSLLKSFMMPMTSRRLRRRRRHRATSLHAAPTDKEKPPRLRTAETGAASGAGNGFKRPPHPRPAHPARRRTPPGPRVLSPQPVFLGPAPRDSVLAPRLGHVAGGELWLGGCSASAPSAVGLCQRSVKAQVLSLRQLGIDRRPLPHRAPRELSPTPRVIVSKGVPKSHASSGRPCL